MRLALIFLAVVVAMIALRIISALKTAHSTGVRNAPDHTKSAAASAGRAVTSSGTGHTLPGALESRKTSGQEKTVAPNTGSLLAGADAGGGTRIELVAPPAVSNETDRRKTERKGMWVDSHYCWVVLCRNHWFHLQQNLFFRHRIPLAETDPVATRPYLEGPFSVRCDDCRKEYLYEPSEVLKYEQELPDSFTPHPLFR